MNVGELIQLPELNNISCIAAENFLDGEISGCGVMEFGESIRWVKKGELVLTSGHIFGTDEMLQRQTIIELKECGCAAVGVKVKEVLKTIPEAMVEEAERQNLPLLLVPFYYSFAEIGEVVYRHSFHQALTKAQQGELLLERMGKIFFAHKGMEAMLQLLLEKTGHTFLVTDIQYNIISLCLSDEYKQVFIKGKDTKLEPVWNSSFFTEGGRKNKQTYRYCNFKIEGTPYRFFVQALPDYSSCFCIPVESGELDDDMRRILDKSGMIIALELARGENIHRGVSGDGFLDFLRDDSEKGEEEIIRLCSNYGFPYQYKRVCMVFRIGQAESSFQREKMKESFRQSVKNEYGDNFRPYLCAGIGIMAAFLTFKDEVSAMQAEQIACKCAVLFADKMTKGNIEITAGVSRCCTGIRKIQGAFSECMEALELQRWERGERKVFQYRDSLVYHVLYRIPKKELLELCRDKAEILEEYDVKNGTKLAETVKIYYDCHFNVTVAAERLYIHRNTMRQRLEKAGELLCCAPDLSDCGYSLYLGLCAWEIMGNQLAKEEIKHDD